MMVFSIELRWLPVSGSATPGRISCMPAIALGYYVTPPLHAARARRHDRGARRRLHPHRARQGAVGGERRSSSMALRNALVPVVALAAVQLGLLLGGSIVIETIFALDGLGYLAYQSITHKDFPVTQAVAAAAVADLCRADARCRSAQCVARSAHQGRPDGRAQHTVDAGPARRAGACGALARSPDGRQSIAW